MAEDLLPTDPEWVGPYRLLGRLGAGGMGEVYLARSPGGRLVAVKVIRPELAADHAFRARFAREAAAARTVSGVFTAAVVDADTKAPQPWLATAYVPGPSLAEAVGQRGPLAPGVVLTLGAGLAEGLQAIHTAGLVHRDLKPSNVLLAGDGPRVIDFGIARAVDASMLTQTGTIMGSPGFLSPEQAMGHEVGPPGDVFSLGSVLAFAASGEGPFGVGTAASLVYRVVNAEPNLSGVPERLRPLIERCLAKDPASRPTAGELLASFGSAQQDQQDQQWLSGPADGAARRDTVIAVGGTGPGRGGHGPRWALIAAAAAVIAGATTGIVLAAGGAGHPSADPFARAAASLRATASARPPAPGPTAKAASPQATGEAASPRASPQATPKATPKNTAKTTPRTASPAASPRRDRSARAAVAGVWTGTYTCNQGLTGVRLTIAVSDGDAVRALAEFYPIAGNPGAGSGSYEMSGSYAAAVGLILTPAYWISQPPGYVAVSISAPPPSGNSMRGTVEGPGCTTFSVTRRRR